MVKANSFLLVLIFATPLMLASCGGDDDKAVIVNPSPGQTVVVPPTGATKVCPAGQTTC